MHCKILTTCMNITKCVYAILQPGTSFMLPFYTFHGIICDAVWQYCTFPSSITVFVSTHNSIGKISKLHPSSLSFSLHIKTVLQPGLHWTHTAYSILQMERKNSELFRLTIDITVKIWILQNLSLNTIT